MLLFPRPFSPVRRHRKFSTVLGTYTGTRWDTGSATATVCGTYTSIRQRYSHSLAVPWAENKGGRGHSYSHREGFRNSYSQPLGPATASHPHLCPPAPATAAPQPCPPPPRPPGPRPPCPPVPQTMPHTMPMPLLPLPSPALPAPHTGPPQCGPHGWWVAACSMRDPLLPKQDQTCRTLAVAAGTPPRARIQTHSGHTAGR